MTTPGSVTPESEVSAFDHDAVVEFGSVSLNAAEERLRLGRWSQAAFDAYHYLWSLGPKLSVRVLPRLSELPDDARRLVEYHYDKAGVRDSQWRHYGLLQPRIGQRVEVRLGQGRERIVAKYAKDRKGPFWDDGGGKESPPAWDEDLWRPL